MNLEDVLKSCPKNSTVINNIIKAYHKINNDMYKKISVAISGGADSDDMLDICWMCDNDGKIVYVWCDTGLEYQATKDHLKYLEKNTALRLFVQKQLSRYLFLAENTVNRFYLNERQIIFQDFNRMDLILEMVIITNW